jgi:glycosyltransferase involved in cell wall biosynthesis
MNGKRIVQIVKTFDGALWAQQQVYQLIKKGWEVHILSPSLCGRYTKKWQESGAYLHQIDVEFPVFTPWNLARVGNKIRHKIQEINPILIHSHFVSTTLMLRWAMRDSRIPRIFQVPGPLHLENTIFGQWETFTANMNDYWIASSEFIRRRYISGYSINPDRVYLSYYGTDLSPFNVHKSDDFRFRYSIPHDAIVVANVSFIYPPKYYLGQKVGLKGHELMIEGLAELMRENSNLYGVFIGCQWGESQKYFNKLKEKALDLSHRFIFTGFIPQDEIARAWKSFDLAIHLPSSENCGGVIEPMLNEIPIVASDVGGLPEIVINGKTGFLVRERTVREIKDAIASALLDRQRTREMAKAGKQLVEKMFNVVKTADEIDKIYTNILAKTYPRTVY